MLQYILLFILVFINWISNACGQSMVTYGKSYKFFSKKDELSEDSKFYLKKADEILSVKLLKNVIYLQKFDARALSLIKIHIYEDFPKKFQIEKVMEFHGRYFLFYSSRDKNDGKEQLFARQIDFEEAVFNGKAWKILKVNDHVKKVEDNHKFHLGESHDHSKLLVRYRIKTAKVKSEMRHELIGYSIYDSTLALLTTKKCLMPYDERKMETMDFSIDSEGTTYILAKVYNIPMFMNELPTGSCTFHMEIIALKFNSDKAIVVPVAVKDSTIFKPWFVNKIWLFEGSGNFAICAGFYNLGGNTGATDGLFLFKINKDGQSSDMLTHAIPLEKLNKIPSIDFLNQPDDFDIPDLLNLQLNDLIQQQDGSILLICEQSFETLHPYYNKYRKELNYYISYHYNNMLLTRIDASGKLLWMKQLPKKQSGLNGKGVMSYKYFAGNKNHYLLFNEDEKNDSLNMNVFPYQTPESNPGLLTAYRISDLDGTFKKIPLLVPTNKLGAEVLRVFPSRIIPVSSNEFVVEVTKKRNQDMLIKVAVPD